MFRIALLFTFLSFSYATTCSQLKTMYSDLTCCANQNVDTCLRSIPLCASTTNGKICIDTNNDAIIKGGSSSYTLPTASTTELGGVKVDGSSIIIANGIISAPIGSSSSSTTAFSGDYNDLTNKPTIPTPFSGDYNDLTNKPTIPTAFSGDYNDLTNKPTSSNVAVDNSTIKQHANGTIYVANAPSGSSTGVVTREGQVLEELAGICSGQTVKGVSGTYTWPDVTASMSTVAGSWTTITGSEISYKPPVGTTEVIYTFNFIAGKVAAHNMVEYRFSLDGNIITTASPATRFAHVHVQGLLVSLVYVVKVGETTDYANGVVASWDTFKTIKVEAIGDDAYYKDSYFHKKVGTDDGTGTNVATTSANELVKPTLNIRAIGVQLNYINFDPTPTALLSAQTFEVSQEECMSSALITSIKAQVAAKLSADHGYGTTAESVLSLATMQPGCAYYSDPTYPDEHGGTVYNRVLFNTNTNGADGPSIDSYAICKYANGDFVLLTDTTAKCKQVHFTLPDNLGALAGVLQTSSTNMGIGISPTAPLHVGSKVDTSISASRFECDGSGAIIEQTSGETASFMSQTDCSALSNYQSSVPAVTAVKKLDGFCVSTSNSPYNFNVVEVTSGTPDESLTEVECRMYTNSKGYTWYGQLSSSSNPKGCMLQYTTVYFNTVGGSCSVNSNSKCLQKLNVKELTSGTPPNDLTEGECKAYGESISTWHSSNAFSNMPTGCLKNGGSIFYNSQQTSVTCSDDKTCIAKDTTFDNPGTTDQGRVDACRDACMDRSKPLFSGEWNFRSASFWVEPGGGQCFCGADDANTCATTASDYIDLYELNNPPKGCFKDSSGNHYHNDQSDDNYGVCSSTYVCLRSDGDCLVKDTNPEVKELSMIVEKSAWFKQEVVISSDRRIKENIVEVEGARERMRQISAKNYSYVDKRKYNGTTVGFIAQEVAQVMPEAVKVEKGFVPNLLKRVTCTYARNNTLNMTCPELGTGRVRLFVTDENVENLLDIDVKNGVMKVEKVYTQVYAFGYEVDDFHTLEKSKLFALNFAATKEMDADVETLKEQVNELIARVKALEGV